jgi:hypothetical protein
MKAWKLIAITSTAKILAAEAFGLCLVTFDAAFPIVRKEAISNIRIHNESYRALRCGDLLTSDTACLDFRLTCPRYLWSRVGSRISHLFLRQGGRERSIVHFGNGLAAVYKPSARRRRAEDGSIRSAFHCLPSLSMLVRFSRRLKSMRREVVGGTQFVGFTMRKPIAPRASENSVVLQCRF